MISPALRIVLVAASIALAPAVQAQTQCASPGTNIIAWWDGTAGAGNLTVDLVGSTDATLESGATIGPMGLFSSQAYVFDGIDDHLASVGEMELLDGDDWTIEAWIRPANLASFQSIVGKLDPAGERAGDFELALRPNGSLQFRYLSNQSGGTNDRAFNTAPVLSPGVTAHVAVKVSNGNNVEILVNGIPAPTTLGFISALLPAGGFDRRTFVGSRFGTQLNFEGEIAEITFYDRELTNAEIADIVQAGNAFKCKQPAPLPAGVVTWYDGEICNEHALDRVGLEAAPLSPRIGADVTLTQGMVGASFDLGNGGGLNTERPLLRTTGPFTVEMWIFRRRFVEETLYSELNQAGRVAGEFVLVFAGGSIRLVRATGVGNQAESVTGDSPIPLDEWSHVAAIFAGPGDLRLFINGQRVEQNVITATLGDINTADGGFGVGFNGFQSLRAVIDECTLYRTAVSDSEIEAIYRAGRFGKASQTTPSLDCRSGSTEDLSLDITLSQGQTLAPPSLQLAGGDSFFLQMTSPTGTFAFNPYGIMVQAYDPATPPFGIPGVPEFGIDFNSAIFLAGGLTPTPFGLPLLDPLGARVAILIPQGLAGTRLRMQGFAINPTAANGTFAATDPIDLQIRTAVSGPGS